MIYMEAKDLGWEPLTESWMTANLPALLTAEESQIVQVGPVFTILTLEGIKKYFLLQSKLFFASYPQSAFQPIINNPGCGQDIFLF